MWERMGNAGKQGFSVAFGGNKRIHVSKHWSKLEGVFATWQSRPRWSENEQCDYVGGTTRT